ncbi:MAG: UDP-N-acetylmuramoyl-L-alanyl-D-glutamate--2,6-diaminopimelate ligase [Rikenellaceae bacterium]|nr:UDP-N-acetylmuramoyl-L-alanyl-D-glutamate--2,6-diaminopimelate ligase [Rikenellaceae bacterium]
MAVTLQNIIEATGAAEVAGDTAAEVRSLGFDSRTAGPGTLFFAVRGAASDGHDYIAQAVGNGAAAVVCEQMPPERDPRATYIRVDDSSAALGQAAAAFYGYPSRKLKLVGVTGTNGKTTTATLLCDLFVRLGYKAGLISTVEYRTGMRTLGSTHTTPDPVRLNEMLAEMVSAGCGYCFMEVSSHSLVQRRVAGLDFAGGVFSNITHDHLDYHGTFAEYIRAKKLFFDALPAGAFALTNADDRNGEVMLQNTKARRYTYSLRRRADFHCRILETHFDGTLLDMDGAELWTGFVGRFNAYNLLAVYAAARLLGQEKVEVLQAVSSLGAVDGRFEVIRSEDGRVAVVDYAHTPDALQNVISTINEIRHPDRRLYTVVGCGGNRDAAKRPVMASIAATQSYMAILTSDNPRHEEPRAIIADMEAGLDPTVRHLSIADRREAIKAAVAMAGPGDIVLVAGKGHETYQDACGVKSHFDDREEVRRAMGIFVGTGSNLH